MTARRRGGVSVRAVGRLRSWRPTGRSASLVDLALAVGLAAVSLVEVVVAGIPAGVAGVALVVLQTAPLALRRRAPFTVYLVVGLAISAYAFLGEEASVGPVATFVAIYTVAAHGTRLQSRAALAIQAGGVMFFFLADGRFPVGDVAEAVVLSILAWTAGEYVRTRRLYIAEVEARAEAQRQAQDQQARQAVADERTRVARELHDVVGHGVTLMVVQAGAGRRVVGRDQDRSEAAFRAIEETGRRTLGELDQLLGILRPDGEEAARAPQPGLDQLGALALGFTDAGLPVEVRIEGEAVALPRTLEVAAYRVAQEALTNALRHAGPARATLTLRYGPGRVEVEVADDGAGPTKADAGAGGSGGRGLAGMRERVSLFGGEVETGPGPDSGFVVRCWIPVATP